MGRPPADVCPANAPASPSTCAAARIEFHIGDEVASLDGREIRTGPIDEPEAVVVAEPAGFYALMVDRDLDAVTIEGDRAAVAAMLDALPPVALETATP
jgi:hypothetical protein